MNNLPTELLSSIHLTLLPTPTSTDCIRYSNYYRSRINALTRIRLVSKQWNDAVLDTPELWSYIEIQVAKWLDTIRLSLKRSKAAPLHIRIDFGDTRPGIRDDMVQMVDLVWSQADRWETFGCEGVARFPLRLLPLGPHPSLREVCIRGKQDTHTVDFQAPRLESLWEVTQLTNIETSGTPALRSWAVTYPTRRGEWERLIKIVENCSRLEWLRFLPHPGQSDEGLRTLEAWSLPDANNGIAFPSLKQIEFIPIPLTVNFLSYILAPNLQRLVIRGSIFSDLSTGFPAPPRLFEACPKLKFIRFDSEVLTWDIQRWLSALSQDLIERLEVEVERQREGWLGPVLITEQQNQLNSSIRIRWVYIES
ncbi:hypothetical protein M407DRAFT_33970 [Tulasnella calospora MUT 4182]|uniref:Uncharacterized protein n=1 Tax=Tulasnella calospora MUT 4182 TaxID=1051891 RepID=A0A0C3L435_9AGAM|nr:hypothetical protein M407DRAFT_33970 [Tulasnella calospora MUT 4182]